MHEFILSWLTTKLGTPIWASSCMCGLIKLKPAYVTLWNRPAQFWEAGKPRERKKTFGASENSLLDKCKEEIASRNGAFTIAMLIYHSTNKQKAGCLTPKPAVNLPMPHCLRKDSTNPKTITIPQDEIKHKISYSVTVPLQVVERAVKKDLIKCLY